MERGAPEGRNRVGADQRVDALSIREAMVWHQTLRNQDAALQSIEERRVERNVAALVAEHDPVTMGDAERVGIKRMHLDAWPPFGRTRCRGLVEGGV